MPLNDFEKITGAGGANLAGGEDLGKKLFPNSTEIGALQASSSMLGAMASLYAGQAKAGGYETQAGEYRMRAAGEGVDAQSQSLGIKNQFLAAVGSQDGRLAAGGYDLGQGVAQSNRTAMAQSATASQGLALLAGKVRADQDQSNAYMADAAASDAKGAGDVGMLGTLLNGGLKLLRRVSEITAPFFASLCSTIIC